MNSLLKSAALAAMGVGLVALAIEDQKSQKEFDRRLDELLTRHAQHEDELLARHAQHEAAAVKAALEAAAVKAEREGYDDWVRRVYR